ncbi:hypothetical protein [Nonomuraea rhodomycinica]|uniref:Uncharacterized protein n=1 Tax=Nonomuraea rhodomycinica TaxID=1712872 RepID=A0A7Y6IXZ3_9ACTN|nr:hypothetical protein [Nonomuraea rhodomycinica]NUW46432.1 hypothetical protein [Nonomuraea rhodomycinica]
MPPFSSPVPEDEEPQEPPRGRRPYGSPTAEPEAEPRRRPRRLVNRPDKLVASGPPRPQPPRPPRQDAGSRAPAAERRDDLPPGVVPAGVAPPEVVDPGVLPTGVVPHSWFEKDDGPPRPDPDPPRDPDAIISPENVHRVPRLPGPPVIHGPNAAHSPEAPSDAPQGPPVSESPQATQAPAAAHGLDEDESDGLPSRARPYVAAPLPLIDAPSPAQGSPHGDASGDGDASVEGDGDSPAHGDTSAYGPSAHGDVASRADVMPRDPTPHEQPEVRRVGRPPGGRPTRPDLLVASGPPRPGAPGGRHHRGPAPSAVRRASPVRGRRGMAAPVAVVLTLALVIAGTVIVWRWNAPAGPALRLAAGSGRSGDDLFTVPSAGDGSNQVLNDMASTGRTVVAVGSDTTSPTPRPLFLVSSDSGRTWRLGQVSGATTSTVRRVVGGGGRWLAIGGDPAGGGRGLWTSADGLAWTAVEESGLAAFRNGDVVADIARTRSGFVAVGGTALADGGLGPVAWWSADGRAWQRTDLRELDAFDLRAVVARGDTVVAVARPAQGEGSRVVRSADGGRTWRATGFQLPEALPRAGSLAVLPKQFLLVPTRQRTVEGTVRVYCSPSGEQWAQCGSIGGLDGESPGVESVITHPGGVAVVAQAKLDSYAVLNSSDGRTWTKRADLSGLKGATLRGFTITQSGTLLAGGDRAAADVDNQLVLLSAPPRGAASRVRLADVEGLSRIARQTNGLAAHDGRYVAVGSASGDAGIWTSLNWKSWTSMSLGGPREQQLADVVHGRRGWLAAGSTQAGIGVTEPLLVSSGDGRSWKTIPATGDLGRAQDHTRLAVTAVAAGPDGYMLAGEDTNASGVTGPALWFTRDLRKFTRSRKLPQGGAGVRVHDLAATPDGYVAVGAAGGGDGERGVVWVSEDGLNWKARKRLLPDGASSAGLSHVTAYQDRLVAIGAARVQGARRVFAAVSRDDGTTWSTAWLPAEKAADVDDLAATDQGLVAVGWHGAPGDADSAAWISQDGTTWTRSDLTKDRLGGPGMQWLAAVTVAGSEVVGLGRSTTYDADHLILWTSTLTSSR